MTDKPLVSEMKVELQQAISFERQGEECLIALGLEDKNRASEQQVIQVAYEVIREREDIRGRPLTRKMLIHTIRETRRVLNAAARARQQQQEEK